MESALRELLGSSRGREHGCSFPLPRKVGKRSAAKGGLPPAAGARPPACRTSPAWQVMCITASDRLEQAMDCLRSLHFPGLEEQFPSCLSAPRIPSPRKEVQTEEEERSVVLRPAKAPGAPGTCVDAWGGARTALAEALCAACDASPEGALRRAEALGFLAQALAPLGGACHAPGSPVAVAFCPFPLCSVTELGAKGFGLGECAPIPELSLQALQRGLLVATFLQGSLGLLRMCLGDFFSGSYTLLLATLGYNSRHPGPASAWLKTYVLISFINGTMGHIDLVQNMLLHNFPAVTLSLPISANLMHVVQLLVPGVSFCGAYFGWQHLKMQRKLMVEAYQRELMMMLEHPPWPPPPLIPLPGMPAGALPPGPMAAPADQRSERPA
mmetsp:Transcript_18962/g.42836  ORF Transcript_18962/g.42836 Transcript_18962/m.42836 type:complete len:384 (-) Transcript_18962:64-1215(-)